MAPRAHHCPGRLRRPRRPRTRRGGARRRSPATRIATAQGIPARFLQAILGDLQHARLVTSQRGREGGYRLALPAVGDLDRPRHARRAGLPRRGARPAPRGRRRTRAPAAGLASVWVAAREAYRRVLEEVTLADVVAGRLPEHVTELVALEDAWRSFGDDAER